MKHRAEGYVTIPVAAVFEYDNAHGIGVQALEALKAEAQCNFCLKENEGEVELTDISPLEKQQ